MKQLSSLLLIAVLAFTFAACDDDTSPATTGTLSIRMTDAPAAYDAIRITFSEVAAHINGQWIVVNGDPVTVDLLEWNNGRSIEIGRAEMGPGKYTQIRLMVTKAEIAVDGVTHDVEIPSAEQTGLKLNGNFDIVAGSTYELVLDFDASKSIVTTGPKNNPTSYKLKPVIRVIEKSMTGSIGGTVSGDPLFAVASVSQGGVEITGTPIDPVTGEFILAFLLPGTYDVKVESFDGKLFIVTGVVVQAGKKTDLGVIQLQ